MNSYAVIELKHLLQIIIKHDYSVFSLYFGVNILLSVWLVEPYVRIQTKTETKPILEINVGANLMFALLTTIVCEPMTEGKRF